MSARLSDVYRIIEGLRIFRANMSAELSNADVKRIWGEEYTNYKGLSNESDTPVVKAKLQTAQALARKLVVPYVVKYIGVSGSVAAGTALESDDIDVFIVLNNFTSWIYRPLMKLRLRSDAVWYGERDQKDKICINFIVEERGLVMQHQDMFVFHELYYLKHLYNAKYWDTIISRNTWLKENYFVKETSLNQSDRLISFLISLNTFIPDFISFILMVSYMHLRKHNPDIKRLIRGYRDGVTEFYLKDFRPEILRKMNKP